MAAAYTALLAKLSGAAKDELVKDQVRWIANRNRACRADPDSIEDCLKNRYAARIKNLRAYAQGTYPAISEQSLAKQGKLGKITWSYDLAYPRFDGANVDFAAVNARFADAAKKIADESTPKAADGPEREQQWYYQQGFTVERPPGGQAATIVVQFDSYSGGAHGYGATRCTLVDLRTGKAVGAAGRVRGRRTMAPGHEPDRRRRPQEAVRRQAGLRRCARARQPRQAAERSEPLLLDRQAARSDLQRLRCRALCGRPVRGRTSPTTG